jgi:hypothetical protein
MQYITEFDPQFDTRPLSYSSLKAFQKSPQHFVEYRTTKKEKTAAMEFGNIVDVLILTPDEFAVKYAIMPENLKKPTSAQVNAAKPSPASVQQILRYNEWCEENKGKTWICKEDYELAAFLAKKTFENAKAKELLDRVVRTQDKIEWTHKATGLKMIGYKDATGDTFIMDLKTSADGSPEGYERASYNLGYPIQGGAYLDAEKTLFGRFPDFFHLVVETNSPYNITVYKVDSDFIALGTQMYNDLMQQIKFCAENNLWYMGYEFHSAIGYHSLSIPGYAKNKINR